jgi:hypothetical protein
MYSVALTLHSFTRWLVLLSLTTAVIVAFSGWKRKRRFTKRDNIIRTLTLSSAHIQFALGAILYFTSPITGYFMRHFSEAVHNRGMRFFGMEHITMMVVAVAMITHGSTVAKNRTVDAEKFKAMAVWYTIALIIIFLSIPWPFSPFTTRPYVRF